MPLDLDDFGAYSWVVKSLGLKLLELIRNRISVGKYTPPLRNN